MNILAKSWESYKEKCIHKDAGLAQILELKTAFLAGALTVFQLQMKITEPTVSEEQGIKAISDLQQGIDQFMFELSPYGPRKI